MDYLFVLLKNLKKEILESRSLSHLVKLREEFLGSLEPKIDELRKIEIDKIDLGQTIFVEINEEILKFIVIKITNSNRIHAKGLEGQYFNKVLSLFDELKESYEKLGFNDDSENYLNNYKNAFNLFEAEFEI